MTEKAIFISRIDDLSRVSGEYTRLYFGVEFCERLLPAEGEIAAAMDFARDKGMQFTFVTPFVSDEGMQRLEALLPSVAAASRAGDEIVVNDWGMFDMVARRKGNGTLEPVLGRLLTRQKRDPRIPVLEKIPVAAAEYLRSFNADTSVMAAFLAENGVRRLELDNVPQGIIRTGPMKASLYVPFGYITTTRLCCLSGTEQGPRYLRKITECGKECREYAVELRAGCMGGTIHLKGNTQFFFNDELPGDLERLKIDRIVCEPVMP